MLLASLILLLLVFILALTSLHLGTHVLVASGLIGVVAASVLIIDAAFIVRVASEMLLLGLLVGTLLISGAFAIWGIREIRHSKLLATMAGNTKLFSASGVAVTDLEPTGTVKILGETWSAESLSGYVRAGVEIYVSEVDGLRLKVWANPEHSRTQEQENRA